VTTYSRRQLVQGAGAVGLGLLAGCGRLPWQALPATRLPQVGLLNAIPSSAEAFRQGLHELGYVEGQNLAIEYRFVGSSDELLPAVAAELVRLPVDVIVVGGDPAIRAVMEATATIPIVMAVSRDPVGSGFIANLARPGGTVTGLSFVSVQLTPKRLELLQQVLPGVSRVAALGPPSTLPEWHEAEAAGRALGVHLQFLEVNGAADLERGLELAAQASVEAVLVLTSPLTANEHRLIAELAAARGLAAIFDRREFAEAGGLMAYGPSIPGQWRRAAYYVDRLLKGTRPADLPVEQPMTFQFVINAKTAQALSLTIPPHVLLQATEVIR
jgi:putative tryptophan/tyrosine transport system substrate-binding protein